MANIDYRLKENAPGPYFVTSECIDCDLCREMAPSVFRRHDGIGFSVVYHQPINASERSDADQGLESCPVEAIGREADALETARQLSIRAPNETIL